jgi:hypothetical protein
MRSRRPQKSFTARQMTDGRPRVVRHPHLDQRSSRGAQLDEQLGREEGTARFDADALERGLPEELARTVHVAHP